MNELSGEYDPIDDLADDFLERYRRGERPSLSEYTDRHPELAERIRAVFPALVALEEVGKAIAASLVEQRRDPGTGGDASLVCEKRLRLLPASVRRPRCQWPLSVK